MTGTGGAYFKYQTSMFTYRSIDLSTEGKNGGMDTSVGQQIGGRIDQTERKYAPTVHTVTRTSIT